MFVTHWCGNCSTEVEFERFDCAEHGAECPELVCTGCGLGMETAPWPVEIEPAWVEVTPAA